MLQPLNQQPQQAQQQHVKQQQQAQQQPSEEAQQERRLVLKLNDLRYRCEQAVRYAIKGRYLILQAAKAVAEQERQQQHSEYMLCVAE
jgi:hypothetical protein